MKLESQKFKKPSFKKGGEPNKDLKKKTFKSECHYYKRPSDKILDCLKLKNK